MSTTEKELARPVKDHNKIIIGIICSLIALVVIYFGMTMYFRNHFYFGTKINGISVSGKTLNEAETFMEKSLQNYTLSIKERGDKVEEIKGSNLGLKNVSPDEFKGIKDRQSPYKWIFASFSPKYSKVTADISYDDKLLKEQIDKLSCFDSRNIVEPKNPVFQYEGNEYKVIDEVMGNKIDRELFYSKVVESIVNQRSEMDLEKLGCYINPKFTSKSDKTKENKELLNKYVSSKVTYTFGDSSESIDGSTINRWLYVDDNFEVKFDEVKMKTYIDVLSKAYNTVGKTRNFKTSSGNTISIGGGDFGWAINKYKEIQDLIGVIKEGKTVTKEPAYSRTAFSHSSNDIGNTYVEIDMTKQHLWFYKDGSLVTDGDVVTGNISKGNGTPRGIYILKYRDKDAVLKGEDYETPVTYWMPFNGNVGIHDATWRKTFGGEIYKSKGSHGCVNAPYNLAKSVFENIKAGTPVICY